MKKFLGYAMLATPALALLIFLGWIGSWWIPLVGLAVGVILFEWCILAFKLIK